ncbi:MAG: hydrolase, partial [Candidatus Heimdallarchaeaceae archaeon]
MYSTIVLHANLQYAEIPISEIPQVVNLSYIPVLSTLLEIPKIEVVLNFTGVTLEILKNSYPEVIDLLKEGIDQGKFELTGCG